MHIAILSPIAWRTPPRHYGPWEQVASNHAEGLLREGHEVTLFATADSITTGNLEAVCPHPYEEDKSLDPKVWEALHISHLMEQSHRFDIIHNHFDFMPLIFSRLIDVPMVTTIHGFSSPKIVPVYRKYDSVVHYVSISNANRHPELNYISTVYNGIDPKYFTFKEKPGEYLLFLGRIHHDKGTREAISIARKAGLPLLIAGIVQDKAYFDRYVRPEIDGRIIHLLGEAGPAQRDRLLGAALALLHPINFEEPFSLSVAESMLCGTPVIAFRRGSMPELIREGETGFLVASVEEAVEKARELNKDPTLIDRKKCRTWAESRFTIKEMIKAYLDVYKKILS
ncbi:MAG: glycosyltransferase family 4 protein [Spirochaetia bacterium]